MVNNWRSSKWGEEISLEYGKALRDYDPRHGSYRVYGSNGPIGWTNHPPLRSGPGVILGRKGAYRGVEFSRDPFFVIDTAYYVVPKTELDMRWLYYAIKFHKLGEIDDGSPIPSTTRAAVYVKDLKIPSLNEQRAIAHALGVLDDKIELNRKMSETLDQMARTIFKSWFMDFDPIRAKNQGKKPFGMNDATAALFPHTFHRSELGEIPKEWKVVSLAALAAVKHGYAFQGKYFSDEPTDMVLMTPGNFSIGGGFKADKLKFYNGPVDKEYELSEGDLIVTMTDLSKAGDTLGYAAFVSALERNRTALHNQRVGRVLPSHSQDDAQYLYQVFCSDSYRNHVLGSATGSTVKHTSPTRILEFKVPCPPEELRSAFANSVCHLYEMQRLLIRENYFLSETRDLLLPRLLSGELQLKEAGKNV